MKMNTQAVAIERSGVGTESTFKIAASAKAFEILSSGLYKDPITAIIRELSCNAYDAHVAAGKRTESFELHLPNSFEPYFYIRDWGIGLSHEDVMSLYTTYFESTKTDTNDAIGAFGLGSKSPFSYTDTYQVVSRHAGKRRTYNIFLNEDRLPSVALMQEIDTSEPDGLEVRLSVHSKDFYAFRSATSRSLRFFDPKPNVVGVHNFQFDDLPMSTLSGDKWYVYRADKYTATSFTAVMGQVAYRVSVDSLLPHLPNSVGQLLQTLNIITFFDIGELEVPPDREEVRYNEKTIKALSTRIIEIQKMFIVELEARINALGTGSFWTKWQQIAAISKELFQDERGMATFLQGKTDNVDLLRFIDTVKTNGLVLPVHLAGHSITVLNNVTGRRVNICFEKRASTLDIDTDSSGDIIRPTITVTPSESTLVVYDDVSSSSMKRLRLHLAQNRGNMPSKFVVIRKLTARNGRSLGWAHDPSQTNQAAEFDIILNALGNPTPIRLSSIKGVSAGPRSTRPIPIYTYRGTTHRGRGGVRPLWNSTFLTTDILDKGGVYFNLDRGKTILDHTGKELPWKSSYEVLMSANLTLINDALGTNYTITDVIGVSTLAYKAAISKSKKWHNVFSTAERLMSQYSAKAAQYRELTGAPDLMHFRSCLMTASSPARKTIANRVNQLNDSSLFKQTFKALVDHAALLDDPKLPVILGVATFEERVLKKPAPVSTLVNRTTWDRQARTVYPMLSFLYRIDDNNITAIIDYVSLVDRSNP